MQRIRESRIVRICLLVMAFVVAASMISVTNDDVYAATKTPAKVTNVKLSNSTTSSLKIKWSKAKYAKKYQVAYKKVGAKGYKYMTKSSKKYKTISKLSSDTAYYIKVRAYNGKKYGKWSSVKKYRTKLSYAKAANEGKVKVSVTDEKVTIKISSLGLNNTATLYSVKPNSYFKADSIDGIVSKNVSGTKIGTFKMNKAKTFTINRTTSSGYDRLYDKYYVVYDGNIIKGPIYATEVEPYRDVKVTQDVPSKKGLVDELSEDSFTTVEDVGANWTALNIDFTSLILANETATGKPIDNSNKNADTIEVNGKTFYINSSYVSDLDYRLSRYQKMGVNVVGICVSFVESESYSSYPRALKYIDDARWTNGFNTSTELGRDYFIAGMEYLANRYSKGNKGLICNYVIGNEIDYAYDWNEVIPNKSKDGSKLPARGSKYLRKGEIETTVDLNTYMEEYSRVLRLANLAVKKYSDDITVSVSLSKEWSKSKGEQQNAKPSSNKRYDSYRPKEILDWLNYYSKKSGDYNWAVTPHNYPVASGNAAAVETGLETYQDHEDENKSQYSAVVSGSYNDTLMMTQSNMEVFQMYLDQKHNQFQGTSRSIYLTENGSSSHDKEALTIEAQKAHAAMVAQHYYRAASLPSVKCIIYYKIQDREAEGATSYKLGLKDTNGNKKLAYNVWKYIDTNRSFDVANKYLDQLSFKKGGIEYSVAKGNIKSYRDIMEIVDSGYDWDEHWDEAALTPVKIESVEGEASLATDKTSYGADDPILVTATGSTLDLVGIYKKGETIDDTAIYSYEISEDTSGKQLDIRAYGSADPTRIEDAKLPAGDYSIILSSGNEELKKIDITITGTSAFESGKKITTNKTKYIVGEDIIVTANGTDKDWVGIYKKGENPNPNAAGGKESIYWYYVNSETQVSGKPFVIQNGIKNANSSNPSAVIQPGEYFVALLENDGYNEITRYEGIVIEAGEVEKLVDIDYELDNDADGFANGTVTITKSAKSADMDCLMYWGDENNKPLEGYAHLAKFKLTGEVTTERMQANTIIPPEAKTLLAYSVAGREQSDEPVVAKLPEGAAYTLESDSNETTRFAVGSDIHLVTEGSTNDNGENTNHHFKTTLEDIVENLPGATGFFACGDIADHGKAGEFKVAMNILKSVEGAPELHMAIGNHDWRTGNPDGQFQKYVNWFNPSVETDTVYYDEWVNGYHYIYLGSEQMGEVASLSNEQLEWLDNLLEEDSEKDQEKPVFVFLHQGLRDSMAGNYVGQWGYSYGVAQDAKLKKIVQKYGQVVMFGGHTHYELDTDNSITVGSEEMPVYVNTGAIGYLWDAYNTQAGEYMYGAHGYHVKVYGNKIYMFGRNFITGEYMPSAMYVIEPVKLDVAKEEITMSVGDDPVNVGAVTEDGKELTYKSSNTNVAKVDNRGVVRAVGEGTAKIYISSESSNTKAINRKIVTVIVE